jgi:hypothetical protein
MNQRDKESIIGKLKNHFTEKDFYVETTTTESSVRRQDRVSEVIISLKGKESKRKEKKGKERKRKERKRKEKKRKEKKREGKGYLAGREKEKRQMRGY